MRPVREVGIRAMPRVTAVSCGFISQTVPVVRCADDGLWVRARFLLCNEWAQRDVLAYRSRCDEPSIVVGQMLLTRSERRLA